MADTERLLNKAQGDSIISALAQIAANILQVPSEKLIIDWSHSELPASGDDHTIYAIPTGDAEDPWDFYVWNDVDEEWVQFDWKFAADSALSTTSENPVQNKVVTAALNNKVDKVTGKGLSTNDYTNEEKSLVATIPNKADTDDVKGTQTATGNPITLTDCAPINAESLVVELEPKQDLHGQSAPYVGGSGKNKLPMTVDGIKAANTSGTWSGNTYTLNGVTFTIQTDDGGNVTKIETGGTASASIYHFVIGENIVLNGNYKFTSGNTNPWSGYNYLCLAIDSNNTEYVPTSNDGVALPSGTYKVVIGIALNTNVDGKVFYPMIRLATETDPTFAPYSNICPITGYTECEVESVGFNVFDDVIEIGSINASGQNEEISSGQYWRSKNYISVKPNESYYKKLSDGYTTNNSNTSLFYFDENKNYLFGEGNRGNLVTTMPSGCYYVRFVEYFVTERLVPPQKICLNVDTPTGTPKNGDYLPYHSTSATIQFGQTVYGGRSNFTDGGTDDEIGVVDLGSLNWSYDATQSHPFFYTTDLSSIIKHIIGLPQPLVACEQYRILDIPTNVTDSAWADASVHASMIYHASSPNYVYVRDDRFTDPTVFKNANSGNHLAYMKATPTQLSTPPTDLKLLKGTNHITTNGTTINLGYIPDNSIGDAVKASEEYTDRRFRVIEQSGAGYLEPNKDLPLVSFNNLGGGNYLVFCKVTILASIPSTDKGYLRVAYNSGQLSPSLVFEAGREYSETILSFTDYIKNADNPLVFTLVNGMDVMADSYTISARVVLIKMD